MTHFLRLTGTGPETGALCYDVKIRRNFVPVWNCRFGTLCFFVELFNHPSLVVNDFVP